MSVQVERSPLATERADPAAAPLLSVSGLTIGFPTHDANALAADDVQFSVNRGETLGIVGESGCGKSVSMRALLNVVPVPGQVLSGTAFVRAGAQGSRTILPRVWPSSSSALRLTTTGRLLSACSICAAPEK